MTATVYYFFHREKYGIFILTIAVSGQLYLHICSQTLLSNHHEHPLKYQIVVSKTSYFVENFQYTTKKTKSQK